MLLHRNSNLGFTEELTAKRFCFANRFWNPSSDANWGDADVWATTDGGDPTGVATPTSSDNVYFTSTNNNNCAVAATADCADIDFTGGTGYTGTFSGSSALGVYGSFALNDIMSYTYSGTMTFSATTAGHTIYTAGNTIGGVVNLNGVNGEWTLNDSMTLNTKNVVLLRGALNLNDKNISGVATFQITGTNTRSLDLTSSTITCQRWNADTTTNLTFDAGTSKITITGTSDQPFGSLTYNDVEYSGTGNFITTGAATFNDLTYGGTGNSATGAYMSIAADIIVGGTFTCKGATQGTKKWLTSNDNTTRRTITAAVVDIDNALIEAIKGAGAGSWDFSALHVGNLNNTEDITFPAVDDLFWVGVNGGNFSDTANWSTSTGGAGGARVPLPLDTCYFDANSIGGAGKTITNDVRFTGGLDFTGVTNTPTVDLGYLNISGTVLKLVSGMTLGGTIGWNLRGQGLTSNVTFAGQTLPAALTNANSFSTYNFLDDIILPVNSALTWKAGTMNAGGNVTVGTFVSDGAGTRVINMGAGTWELRRAMNTTWVATGSNLTLNKETANIKITNFDNTALSFQGGDKTYNNIWFARGTSTAINTITGTNTFAEFKDTGTEAHTITFPNVTTTVTSTDINGSAGKLITLQRTGASGTWTISDSAGTNTVTYCNISNSTAEGGAEWNALTTDGNVDGGGNTGWTFTPPSTGGGAMLLLGVG
jgi:hypothetical protein